MSFGIECIERYRGYRKYRKSFKTTSQRDYELRGTTDSRRIGITDFFLFKDYFIKDYKSTRLLDYEFLGLLFKGYFGIESIFRNSINP